MLKFRTMKVQEDGPVVVQAVRQDPRVTSIGRFLRAASIDELPQLFNVLKGEMSLIGPRPHALAHDSYFEKILEDYAFRHHVKPGLTGWAQCNGSRGATPTVEHVAERVRLDLWYVNNWSLWLDIQILIKTFLRSRGSETPIRRTPFCRFPVVRLTTKFPRSCSLTSCRVYIYLTCSDRFSASATLSPK